MSATDVIFTNADRGITAMKLNLMVRDLNAAIAAAGGGGGTVSSGALIYGEVPAGTLDGINKNFTATRQYRPNMLSVFLNGVRQRRTNDYTETSNNSFSFVTAPQSGDILSIDYMQAAGSAVTAFGSQTPASSNTGSYTLGNTLQFNSPGQIVALLYYRYASGMAASRLLRVWSTSGTQQASASTSGETGTGWKSASLATPLTVSTNQNLVITTDLAAGETYCFTAPPITCDTSYITWIEGRYTATLGTFPGTTDPHNYFTDVSFQPIN